MTLQCIFCKKVIDCCCYPAYNGVKKIGYRHIFCPDVVQKTKDTQPVIPHNHNKVIVEDYNYDHDDVRYEEDET